MVVGACWARPLLELCSSSEPEQALRVPASFQGAGREVVPGLWPPWTRKQGGRWSPAPRGQWLKGLGRGLIPNVSGRRP